MSFKLVARKDGESTLIVRRDNINDLIPYARNMHYVRILDGFTPIFERVGKRTVINSRGLLVPRQ